MRIATILLSLLLANCGFTPIYAENTSNAAVANEMAHISIGQIEGRNGQILRNHLVDRMHAKGQITPTLYRLQIILETKEIDLGIRKDATATRAQLHITGNVVLVKSDGTPAYQTETRQIVSYNILDPQYGTLSAKNNAYERGLSQLADEIVTRLGLYFARDVRQ